MAAEAFCFVVDSDAFVLAFSCDKVSSSSLSLLEAEAVETERFLLRRVVGEGTAGGQFAF